MERENANPETSSGPPAGATEAVASKPAKKKKREKCAEVSKLEPAFQDLTDRLLEEGSPFEEVIETVRERGGPVLTLNALRDYFRHNRELQIKRVKHQKEAADVLRAAIGHPETAEGELAAAAYLTGFMGVNRAGSEASLKDSEVARLKRENLRLQQRNLQIKEANEIERRKLMRTQAAFNRAKISDLRRKVREVSRELKKNPQVQELAPEILQKIDEIYGIVQTPPPFTPGAAQSDAELGA